WKAVMNSLAKSAPTPAAIASVSHSKPVRVSPISCIATPKINAPATRTIQPPSPSAIVHSMMDLLSWGLDASILSRTPGHPTESAGPTRDADWTARLCPSQHGGHGAPEDD